MFIIFLWVPSQYLDVFKDSPEGKIRVRNQVAHEQDQFPDATLNFRKNFAQTEEKTGIKTTQLVTEGLFKRNFSFNPSCFKLLKNQKVDVKVCYIPREPAFHYEKLAILADNGEIRWIAVKGMGLDTNSDQLLDIRVRGKTIISTCPIKMNSTK